MERQEFKAGDIILEAGDAGDSAYFIFSGSVDVFVVRDGQQVELAQLGKGEIFGEMALIDPGPRSASVRARENTICMVTGYDDFQQSMKDNPDLALTFLHTLISRLRETNRRIAELSGEDFSSLRQLFQRHGPDRSHWV